jgi:glycosyltransferase involved in cell wall biosynthesis
MISVVIPLYNKANQVANTLQSVFKQTFQDFEVVIVNDGSTDNSVLEVEKFDDPRIRLIHQDNAGVSVARNRGIAEAHNELIAFLDADDEWKPEYLVTQYALSKKYPECSVFACNYEFKNSDGIKPIIIRKLPFTEIDGILTNYFEVASCSHPPICSISIMIKKEAILSVGGFPVGIKSGEDLLTWARLAVVYKIAYSRSSLAIFHCPIYVTDRNNRFDAKAKDNVYSELRKLLSSGDKRYHRDLRKYIGHWNEMRMLTFLEHGMGIKTTIPAYRVFLYNGLSLKALILALFAILPGKLQSYILKYRRKVNYENY